MQFFFSCNYDVINILNINLRSNQWDLFKKYKLNEYAHVRECVIYICIIVLL